jgi:hypothetical protein
VPACEEYQRRLASRQSRAAHYERIHSRLGNARLGLALAGGVVAWQSLLRHSLSPWWLALPVAGFALVAAYHARILRARDRAQRGVDFYGGALERVENRWAGTGSSGQRFDDPHHVYASDLDLFCEGGLFELLFTARTRSGEETLANWLLSPASLEQIGERHRSVDELRDQLDLREDLAALGRHAKVGIHPQALLRWAGAPAGMRRRWILWVATMLGVLAIAGVVLWGYSGIVLPLLVLILIEAMLMHRLRKPLEELLGDTEEAFRDLDLLHGVLARVERCSFGTPSLRALQQQLWSGKLASSRAISQLRWIVDLIGSRRNPMVRLLDVPLMYSVQVGFAAERWRRTHGQAVRSWLGAIGEMEALLCLATYSYENPNDPLPEFAEGGACFDAVELGHPLLPAATCVRNDVSLSASMPMLLVSGSNMSGKSTLMRAIGTNVVLAMAGAPVRARRLRLTPLRVGVSIRINDSLAEGSSRFYAEITRLRKLFELAGGNPPLLFLLDELLQGTNSKDRRTGAEAIVRALLKHGAIGLISTHDLALTEIGELPESRLRNVHFQDQLEGGIMKFDYKLREGVVTKSNGLELMRLIGLDV